MCGRDPPSEPSADRYDGERIRDTSRQDDGMSNLHESQDLKPLPPDSSNPWLR